MQLGVSQLFQGAFLRGLVQRLLQLLCFLFQLFVFGGCGGKRCIVLFQRRVHLLHSRDILVQKCTDFCCFSLGIERIDTCKQFFQLGLLLGQASHLLEHPWRDMVAPGFAGAFATLQVGIFLDHVLPEPVLPLCQFLLVADDFLGTEPPIRRQRDKRKVHMRRFLVHMHHGGYDRFRVLVFPNKVQRLGEIGLDFTLFLAFEELRAGRHQRLHHPHTVRPRAAARFCNLLFCLCPVLAFRRNQVKIQVTAGCVHIGITGVFFLGALVVRLNIGNLRPFVLGKAENGKLRLMSVLNLDEASANELLQMYWDEVLRGEESLSTAGNDEFYFSTERFTVSSGTEDIPIYVCDVCGKTTTMNCKDMCTTLKCGGHLRRITHDSLLKDNHYAKLYQSSLMQPLHIKEHTAQLGREEQQKYQEMFVNKEINALSCSTTFEMGVDVGDLETVYLRNMPPSPANYVQRAGRAGRGKNAAAFSLTYAKLSSHDFTYFKNPENMITGKIGVPLFTVRNEKIILRHIFAVALSDFFAKQVDVYNSNNADVLLSGDGWERFCAYLSSKPEHLKDVLKASIPESMHRVMGINDFSWTEKLVGKDGVLKVAVEEFRGTVQYYIDEYRRLLAEGLTQQAAAVEKKLWSYRRGKEDNRGRNELIEFLVRNNVLPKYGFPVDTVELYQNTNAATDKKLQMVRDLQLAISEYAPDSQVVADGKLYTSRYIRKLPQTTGQDWETAYIAQCNNPSCMTWNHRLMEPDEGGEPCVSCHVIISKSRWKQAIEPRKGFVADAKPKDVPMRKPDKAFRSDDFYIGDAQRQVMQKYAFVMKDGNRFQMETSINDSLMVVCNDDFYVCPHCGYAESTMENMEVAGFNSHQKTLEKKHITPWGKNCEVKLVKNKLCHVFKTDVVRLVFSTPQAGNQEVMLSVMYALLEALSSVMDIERNDIKGCLHKIVYDNKLIYAIVLYDAVAGGAGHVRRLVTEDGRCFRQVVEKAIAITKGCNCSPSCYSCLRNYYNQKIHDLLNRKYAYDFLENYYGELEPITNEEFENGELYNV